MVTSDDPGGVLRIFTAILKAQIDRDLAEAPDNFDPLWPLIRAYRNLPKEERTAAAGAADLHNRLVHAYAASIQPELPDIIGFHFASLAARQVAETAKILSLHSGTLGAINQEIDRLRVEGGYDEYDDEWPNGEEPAEHAQRMERCGEMLNRIEQMMIVDTLRRYGLNAHADLFESDPEEFEAKAAAGRRIFHPDGGPGA